MSEKILKISASRISRRSFFEKHRMQNIAVPKYFKGFCFSVKGKRQVLHLDLVGWHTEFLGLA